MTGPCRRVTSDVLGRALLVALSCFLAVVGLGAVPIQVAAQPQPEAAAIVVVADEARPSFPDGIEFSLEAYGPDPIVEVALYYRPAADETLRLATPRLEPDDVVSVEHEVDLRGGKLPPGVDVAYHWRMVDAAGKVRQTEERIVLWADHRFAWETVSGARVTVFAYNGDPAFNQTILDTAERTIDRLAQEYGATLSEPIRIWVYSAKDDLVGALAPNSEPWIAGAAYPNLGLILAVLPTGDQAEVGRVIPHEISHQVLNQATDNPFNHPPTWLNEGLAVLAQESGGEDFQAWLDQAGANGNLDSLRVLNSQFPFDHDGAMLGYAQSMSVVSFIVDTYGEEAIARLIAVFREGVSSEEAVQQALGLTLDELDAQWRASLDAAATEGAAAGTNRTEGDPGGLGTGHALALASGTLLMGLAAILAVLAGTVALVRARRRAIEPEEGPAGGAGRAAW